MVADKPIDTKPTSHDLKSKSKPLTADERIAALESKVNHLWFVVGELVKDRAKSHKGKALNSRRIVKYHETQQNFFEQLANGF